MAGRRHRPGRSSTAWRVVVGPDFVVAWRNGRRARNFGRRSGIDDGGECVVDDASILQQVNELVDEEHHLRGRLEAGEITAAEEHARLGDVEAQLDQCWDLLRQRRARRLADQDPEGASARPVDEVEGYVQ
jgi:hypothetical protein